MFLDWPDAKEELDRSIAGILDAGIRARSPLIASIRMLRIPEGSSIAHYSRDGDVEIVPMKGAEARTELPREQFEKNAPSALVQAMQELLPQMVGNLERELFETANSVPGAFTPVVFSEDPAEFALAFAATLERLEVEFDEDGNPSHVLIVHPETAHVLQEMERRMQDYPEVKSTVDAVWERKKLEWSRREADRRLDR